MSTITNADIARLLTNIPQEEREKFISDFFQLLMYGLEKDKTVKIKGLGTFKISKTKTSDEDTMPSRQKTYKLSFIAENSLQDLANRAFSSFEPVTLNEGVEFDDLTELECTDFKEIDRLDDPGLSESLISFTNEKIPEKQESRQEDRQENRREDKAAANTPLEQPSHQTDDAPAVSEKASSADKEAGRGYSQDVETQADETLSFSESQKSRKWMWYLIPVACIAGLLLFFGLNQSNDNITSEPVANVVAPDSTLQNAPSQDEKTTTDTYAELNAKIPYGAYEIVGVDTVITVTKGMDLNTIARIFLGTEMQVYLVVMNEGNDHPSEGQSYKIPKLQLKRKK